MIATAFKIFKNNAGKILAKSNQFATPKQLGAVAWFDSNYPFGFDVAKPANNSQLTTVNDLSGVANVNPTQGTSGNKPLWVDSGGYNNKSGFKIADSNDSMVSGNWSNGGVFMFATSLIGTMVMYVRTATVSVGSMLGGVYYGSGGTLVYINSSGRFCIYSGGTLSTSNVLAKSNTDYRIRFYKTTTGSSQFLEVTEAGTGPVVSSSGFSYPSSTTNYFYIGRFSGINACPCVITHMSFYQRNVSAAHLRLLDNYIKTI